MIPEFPQAPIIAPWAAACQLAAGSASSGSASTASAADSSVRYMFVPVSASGTGKTFSASMPDLVCDRASAASRHHRRTAGPSITSAVAIPAG